MVINVSTYTAAYETWIRIRAEFPRLTTDLHSEIQSAIRDLSAEDCADVVDSLPYSPRDVLAQSSVCEDWSDLAPEYLADAFNAISIMAHAPMWIVSLAIRDSQ